ncbi:MAG: tripartite tricarboxylate transporter substrate-binding protein, partial [Proteobacteria bacterium]|nr:tripartite tricarboxylate transporter substrate-binding protein [Pseudomonadota bacterium]
IGTEAAAKAAPDGYTIYQGNSATLGINPALHAKLPYDAIKDFAPISLINTGTLIVVVHPSLPVTNVRELIALAKTQPGKINYASAGPGSPAHLVAEMFKSEAKVNFTHIPYKGAAPAAIDLIAGQVDLMFGDFITCFPYIKAGRLRALAVTAGKRSPLAPEIPTVKEAGGPDLQAVSWSAILAPAGTPAAIVQRLNSEIVRIATSADFNEKMRANGGTPITSTPEELATYMRAEIVRYTRAVKDSGTKIE